jgi:hypothetical protein
MNIKLHKQSKQQQNCIYQKLDFYYVPPSKLEHQKHRDKEPNYRLGSYYDMRQGTMINIINYILYLFINLLR